MANALAVTLHASATESSSSASTAIDIGSLRSCLKLRLELDALTGTSARATVYIETASSTAGPWRGLGSFPALTVAATKDQVFADCLRYNRVRWTLEGTTPAATFTVDGQAHVLYAKVADVGVHAIQADAIKSVSTAEQAACCLAATDEADGYIGGGKTLPLTAWGDDLTAQVASIAAYKIMKRRGFQPQGTDELIVKGRDDAISWLKGVGNGSIEPPGMIDSTPEVYDAGISVFSDAPIDPTGRFW